MADVVLLDAGPLGMISHPRAKSAIVTWLATLVTGGVEVLVPEPLRNSSYRQQTNSY